VRNVDHPALIGSMDHDADHVVETALLPRLDGIANALRNLWTRTR
jgi:hypothetical protein